jgi:aminoglycoside phosphotransferase (APT) family kinase protein
VIVDIEQAAELDAYLRGRGYVDRGERLEIRTLAGGVSNKTVYVRRQSGEAWVLKQALPKLRVPVDWFCPPERILREAAGIRALGQIAPQGTIPRLIFEDAEQYLIIMEAAPEPHENWKTMLLAGRLDTSLVEQFAALLAIIHCGPCPPGFEDRSFFEALRLEPYYFYTANQVPQSSEFLSALIDDTRATRRALVHGDYSPKNVLVHKGRLLLLDHEVIHFGDPAFDVGFSLAHLLSKAHHLTAMRNEFVAAAQIYWDHYRGTYDAAERRCVHHTLGCLLARVAGRSQLEYLTPQEKSAQRSIILRLMAQPPVSMPQLIGEFAGGLEECQ